MLNLLVLPLVLPLFLIIIIIFIIVIIIIITIVVVSSSVPPVVIITIVTDPVTLAIPIVVVVAVPTILVVVVLVVTAVVLVDAIPAASGEALVVVADGDLSRGTISKTDDISLGTFLMGQILDLVVLVPFALILQALDIAIVGIVAFLLVYQVSSLIQWISLSAVLPSVLRIAGDLTEPNPLRVLSALRTLAPFTPVRQLAIDWTSCRSADLCVFGDWTRLASSRPPNIVDDRYSPRPSPRSSVACLTAGTPVLPVIVGTVTWALVIIAILHHGEDRARRAAQGLLSDGSSLFPLGWILTLDLAWLITPRPTAPFRCFAVLRAGAGVARHNLGFYDPGVC